MGVTTDKHQLILTVNGKEVGNTLKELDKGAADLRKQIRGLEVGSKEWVDSTKEYQKVQKRIKEVKKEIEGVDKEMSKFKSTVIGIGSAFAATFAVNAIFTSVKDLFFSATDSAKQFQTQLSNLKAITGASAKDLEYYAQEAKNIGETTTASAIQAVEAFKLIGSAKPELLENKEALAAITREAIALSDASGMDLTQSATALTDALNQFGAPAEEAGRYINVLAAGSKFGAAEIPQVTDALLKFGVAAKASNISIEESTALIETLAEKGLKGAEAGTALRNVLAKLSAPDTLPKEALEALKDAGVDVSKLSDKTLPLNDRLNELAKIQGDVTTMTRVFGLENKTAAQILIENRGRVEELTLAVTGTQTAYEQAAINTDNYETQQKKLNNTIEASKIKIGNEFLPVLSSGMSVVIPLVTKMTAGFITFIQIIKGVPKFIKDNKDLFILLGMALLALNAAQIATTASTLYFIALEKGRAIATRASALAQNLLNAAMTANPIGLVIKAVALLIGGFVLLYNRSEKVRAGIAGLADAAVQIFQNIKNAALGILGGVADLLVGVFTLDVGMIKKGLKSAFKGVVDLHTGMGKGVGAAFNKGYDDKMSEEAKKRLKDQEEDGVEQAKQAEKLGEMAGDAYAEGHHHGKKKKEKKKRDKEKEQREKDEREAAKNLGKLRAELEEQLEEDEIERRILALKHQAQKEISELKGNQQQIAQQRKLILQIMWNEIDKLEEDRAAKLEAKNKELAKRAALAQTDLDIIYAGKDTDALIAATQAKLDLQMEMELENEELTQQEIQLIKERYAQMSSEMEERFRQDKKARDLATAHSANELLQGGFQALNDFSAIKTNERIKDAEKEKNAKIKKLDEQLASGKISQASFEAQKRQTEEETAKKTAKLKTKQAQQDKQLRIQESIIAGILAVVKALPSPYAIVVGALAALSTAKIIATPIPEFGKGGWLGRIWKGFKKYAFGGLIKGPSHEQNGIKLVNSQTGQVQGEIEGNEFIINKGVAKNPSLLAEAIDLNERAKRFADGGPVNPLSTASKNPVTVASQGVAASSPSLDLTELVKLRQGFESFKEEISDWQRNLSVHNNLQETESGLSTLNDLREKNKF